jgi:hypothetical protein
VAQVQSLPSKLEALSSNLSTSKIKNNYSQAPVPHTCNPSYSGNRDQEDLGLKPVLETLS